MSDDSQCPYRWVNKYKENRRCMLDRGHSMLEGHKHGIEAVREEMQHDRIV